jgi:hypothetical protein
MIRLIKAEKVPVEAIPDVIVWLMKYDKRIGYIRLSSEMLLKAENKTKSPEWYDIKYISDKHKSWGKILAYFELGKL